MNPLMNNMATIVNHFRRAQGNPGYVRDLLLQSGRINQEAFDAMSGMSASQMANYLMDNGQLDRTASRMAQSIPQNMMR